MQLLEMLDGSAAAAAAEGQLGEEAGEEGVFGQDATDPRTQLRTFLENAALVSTADDPDQEKARSPRRPPVCLGGQGAHQRQATDVYSADACPAPPLLPS